MNEINKPDVPGFAEAFRHELACVSDRRRSQRIESLALIGADGDYSRTAVRWAIKTSFEEVRLAEMAVEQARQATVITQAVDDACLAVGRLENPRTSQQSAGVSIEVASIARRARDAVKSPALAAGTGPSSPVQPLESDPDDPLQSRYSGTGSRLRSYLEAVEKKLAEAESEASAAGTADERLARATAASWKIAETAFEFLTRTSIIRAENTADGPGPGRAFVESRLAASTNAMEVARERFNEVRQRAHEIRVFATANTSAEVADKLSAVAALRRPTDSDVPDPFARELLAAAAAAISAAARAAAEAMQCGDAGINSTSVKALRSALSAFREVVTSFLRTAGMSVPTTSTDRALLSGVRATIAEVAATMLRGCIATSTVLPPNAPDAFAEVKKLLDELNVLAIRAVLPPAPGEESVNTTTPPTPWPDRRRAIEDLLHAERRIKEKFGTLTQANPASEVRKAAVTLRGTLESEPAVAQAQSTAGDTPPNVDSFTECAADCAELAYGALHLLLVRFVHADDLKREAQAVTVAAWNADVAKRIASRAVRDLGAMAIRVTKSAWAAENETADAIRAAIQFVSHPKLSPPRSPTPGPRAGGTAGAVPVRQINASGEPPALGPDVEPVRLRALDMELVGLAFSGGGIRSGTFGLGVLQALGQLRLLRIFDYFSTVSGGGYIGSWLAAWVHREGSLLNVEKQLEPGRVAQAMAQRTIREREDSPGSQSIPLWPGAVDEEPEPINHLRAYSRYLTPRTGIFSADTWTLGSIYLRNLLVNLVSLLPAALAVVLFSRLLIWVFTFNREAWLGIVRMGMTVAAIFSAVLIAVWLYQQRIRLQEAAEDPNAHPDGADRITAAMLTSARIALAVVALFVLVLFWKQWGWQAALAGSTVALLLLFATWLGRDRFKRIREELKSATALGGTLLLFLGSLLVVTSLWLFSFSPPSDDAVLRLTGVQVEQLHLPLRHPGYYWLNTTSPLAGLGSDNKGAAGKFAITFGVGMALLSLLSAVLHGLRSESGRQHLGFLFGSDVVLGTSLGAFVFLALRLVAWNLGADAAAIVTLGVPAILVAMVLASYTEMLVLGRWMKESEREWRSRLGAVLFMLATGWLLFFGASLYLPWAILKISSDTATRNAIIGGLTAAWGIVSGLSAWAGRWLQEGGASRRSGTWIKVLALVGPAIFLTGLVAALSALTFILPPVMDQDWLDAANDPSRWAGMKWGGYFFVAISLTILFSLTVDVNLFSLHLLYANRLIRGYLGASRRKQTWRRRARGPYRDLADKLYWNWAPGSGGAPTDAKRNPIARREPSFTGFDPADDFPLRDLEPVKPESRAAAPDQTGPDNGYRGPYPLFNTALSLAADSDLAVQDRKATSFVLTPDFCGSKATGYARIPPEGQQGEYLTLGRAMTISGAAVDPNMALPVQSPPLTALMTILNTRLGWWIQNPARWIGTWAGAGPFAGMLLLKELFGQTDQKSEYIHLSDGGHFENLGVYELVRRRCRYIVATDATEDRHAASVNLGNLIRLVRTDFGISIDVGTEQLIESKDGLARWHCAIGVIHYEEVDEKAISGVLVYLRAVLTGDESPDVRQYADTCPDFPHQTTFDQFYSEAQFESYRALGHHVVLQVFGEAAASMNQDACDPITIQSEIQDLFADVRRRWFPSPPRAEQEFLPIARMSLKAKDRLGDDTFQKLRHELYPELFDRGGIPQPVSPAGSNFDESGEMNMVSRMLQSMEMVWFAMNMDGYYAHPLNRGWMNLFRRWTGSATFQKYWPFLRAEFSQDFVRFCERALNMLPVSAVVDRLRSADAVVDWLGAVRRMDQEFLQEWAVEADHLRWLTNGRYISDSVASSTAFARKNNLQRPPVWMLAVRNGHAGPAEQPCGLVTASPPFRGAGNDLEFFVWLRGPYRSLGVGRQCLNAIISDLTDDLCPPAAGGQQANTEYRLLVYHPESGTGRAERLQKTLWMNFFFDHQFRSVSPTDRGALAGVTTLARELRK